MSKLKTKNKIKPPIVKKERIDLTVLRRNRIEQLKTMINNDDYLSEAVVKLANSLTSGLMK
jgi:hypothetical protein